MTQTGIVHLPSLAYEVELTIVPQCTAQSSQDDHIRLQHGHLLSLYPQTVNEVRSVDVLHSVVFVLETREKPIPHLQSSQIAEIVTQFKPQLPPVPSFEQ
jgi:hypothetical protein